MRRPRRGKKDNNSRPPEPPAAPTPAPEETRRREVTDYIRRRSQEGALVPRGDLAEEPIKLLPDEIDAVLIGLQEEGDIKAIHGKKDSYFFSEDHMSHSFAKLSARLVEQDLLGMLAEQVRDDSRIYPRPTPARQFYGAPYNIGKEQLVELLTTIRNDEEYSDIEFFETTNGAQYLVSRKHMHPDQARAIAQMQEVEEPELFF